MGQKVNPISYKSAKTGLLNGLPGSLTFVIGWLKTLKSVT